MGAHAARGTRMATRLPAVLLALAALLVLLAPRMAHAARGEDESAQIPTTYVNPCIGTVRNMVQGSWVGKVFEEKNPSMACAVRWNVTGDAWTIEKLSDCPQGVFLCMEPDDDDRALDEHRKLRLDATDLAGNTTGSIDIPVRGASAFGVKKGNIRNLVLSSDNALTFESMCEWNPGHHEGVRWVLDRVGERRTLLTSQSKDCDLPLRPLAPPKACAHHYLLGSWQGVMQSPYVRPYRVEFNFTYTHYTARNLDVDEAQRETWERASGERVDHMPSGLYYGTDAPAQNHFRTYTTRMHSDGTMSLSMAVPAERSKDELSVPVGLARTVRAWVDTESNTDHLRFSWSFPDLHTQGRPTFGSGPFHYSLTRVSHDAAAPVMDAADKHVFWEHAWNYDFCPAYSPAVADYSRLVASMDGTYRGNASLTSYANTTRTHVGAVEVVLTRQGYYSAHMLNADGSYVLGADTSPFLLGTAHDHPRKTLHVHDVSPLGEDFWAYLALVWEHSQVVLYTDVHIKAFPLVTAAPPPKKGEPARGDVVTYEHLKLFLEQKDGMGVLEIDLTKVGAAHNFTDCTGGFAGTHCETCSPANCDPDSRFDPHTCTCRRLRPRARDTTALEAAARAAHEPLPASEVVKRPHPEDAAAARAASEPAATPVPHKAPPMQEPTEGEKEVVSRPPPAPPADPAVPGPEPPTSSADAAAAASAAAERAAEQAAVAAEHAATEQAVEEAPPDVPDAPPLVTPPPAPPAPPLSETVSDAAIDAQAAAAQAEEASAQATATDDGDAVLAEVAAARAEAKAAEEEAEAAEAAAEEEEEEAEEAAERLTVVEPAASAAPLDEAQAHIEGVADDVHEVAETNKDETGSLNEVVSLPTTPSPSPEPPTRKGLFDIAFHNTPVIVGCAVMFVVFAAWMVLMVAAKLQVVPARSSRFRGDDDDQAPLLSLSENVDSHMHIRDF